MFYPIWFLGEWPRGGEGPQSATRGATSSQRKYCSENPAELPWSYYAETGDSDIASAVVLMVLCFRTCSNDNKWSCAANSCSQTSVFAQVFFKCHYDYDPANDNLIPCKEAGLRFETGDILQIVNQDDVNWWQVKCKSSISSPLCEVSQKGQCILKWRSHWVFSRDLCVFSNILDILSVCLCYLGSSCGGWKHRTDPKSDAWGEEESLCKERCGADTHR